MCTPCHQGVGMPNDNLHWSTSYHCTLFLSLIDEAFSALKAAIKARLNGPRIQLQLMDPRGHILQQVNISRSHFTCLIHVYINF